jgi:hypothetical protein
VAHRDHGLEGQHHAHPEERAAPGFPEVRHLRVLVQRPADAVAHERPHHPEARRLHVLLNRRRHVAEPPPGPALGDPQIQGLPRDVEQPPGLVGDLAHRHGHRGIRVVALHDRPQVEPDDVAFPEPAPRRGNPVHDLFVDRRADRRREPPIPLEGRLRLVVPDEALHLAVDLEGRHARLHQVAAHPEGVGQDPAGLAHVADLGGRLQLDHRAPSVAFRRSSWTVSTAPVPEIVARRPRRR